MSSVFHLVLCLALAPNLLKASPPEEDEKDVAIEDLKDLLHTSMHNIVSLNDLVTELTEKISKLTISSAETTAEMKKSKVEAELSKAALSREIENLKEEISKIKENLTHCEDCKKDEGPWNCYHYTSADREWRRINGATEAEMCEQVPGGRFTKGKNDLMPECGSCWCCQDQSALVPINGDWTCWTDWTVCSAECDKGTQTRTRTCTNPAPAYGGADCRGETEETQECNSEPCPDYTMFITCDDQLTVFIDGAETRVPGLESLSIPSSTELIAVQCANLGGGYGIIGSVQNALGEDILATDSSWKCSSTWESGWSLPNFKKGDNWVAARDLGDGHFMLQSTHGWKDVPSPNKRVIWTASGSDTTIYCRKALR